MNRTKVAVVGASGYSGEELVRLLVRHEGVELAAVTSREHAGKPLSAVYPKFLGTRYGTLPFIESTVSAILAAQCPIVFLALPHGVASEFAVPLVEQGIRVLDLSADFRIKDTAVYESFYGEAHHAPALAKSSVYGMPEIHREEIRSASLVACPGCYPTSIILPLHPLLRAGLIDPTSIVAYSMSGVSGAGRNAKLEYLFVECNESTRAYGIPKHRHLSEIEQELSLAAGQTVVISFLPHLVPTNRGIHTTITCQLAPGIAPENIGAALETAYGSEPFVRLLSGAQMPDTKNVTHSNFVDIAWRHDPRTGRIILLSAEDNLIKGASGQAVQCLNLLCNLPETMGLL